MSAASKIPSLRFKGFGDDWDRKSFSDFAKVSRGLTYTPKDCEKYGIRVLRSSNVEDDKFVLHDNDVFVKKEAANIPSVKNDDILITAANGSSQLVGKHALVGGIEEGAAVHGGFMLLATSTESVFLNVAMSAPWYRKAVASGMMGGNGALGNLCQDALEMMTFIAPKWKRERDKIGTTFRSLDALIADRESAVEKLRTLKKAMLEKMFPRAGAKVPEVRFKGFAGEWEEKRLGDTFSMSVSTNTLSRACLSEEGTVRNIHYGDILTKFKSVTNITLEDFPCITDKGFKTNAKNLLQDGDVVMADTAEDEMVGKVTEIRNVGCVHVVAGLHTVVLRPLNNFGAGYLGYYLNADAFHLGLLKIMQGVKVLSINKSFLADYSLLFPSFPEQLKIGAYFRSLDTLISARQEEVSKLKDLKKALLDRMFV